MINSSYLNKLSFGELISVIVFLIKPQKIVEFGILDGYSLNHFIQYSKPSCQIEAYDIFDEFNGNHADFQKTINKFSQFKNVKIQKGNFFKVNNYIEDNSIDILHVDIANNGEIFEYVFDHYVQKMRKGGIILLEGGSKERDKVKWMVKYGKKSILEVLEKYKTKYDIHVVQSFPSMTLICL